jgi:hypothetical protein
MRFITDGMLGKLTRWLRLSGHDTIYTTDLEAGAEGEDNALLQAAKSRRRTLLTSDVGLYRRAKKLGVKCALLRGEGVVEQLVELSGFLGRRIEMNFEKSRCPVCNGRLREAKGGEVEKQVPRTVLERHERFWLCKGCGKVYWEGRHWKGIIRTASEYERSVEHAIP